MFRVLAEHQCREPFGNQLFAAALCAVQQQRVRQMILPAHDLQLGKELGIAADRRQLLCAHSFSNRSIFVTKTVAPPTGTSSGIDGICPVRGEP